MGSALGTRPARRAGAARRGGFTLIEVMVSVAIIAILLAVMLPAMSMVRESTRRVVCASNLRQIGLALSIYADDNGGRLPFSYFADGPPEVRSPLDTVVIRSDVLAAFAGQGSSINLPGGPGAPSDRDLLPTGPTGWRGGAAATLNGPAPRAAFQTAKDSAAREFIWDGTGLLVAAGYLSSGEPLYCPSHHGSHNYSRYARMFAGAAGEVVVNFQYRGWSQRPRLDRMPPTASIATDGFRDLDEINHFHGFNILRAGLSVDWYNRKAEELIKQVASGQGADGTGIGPTSTRPGEGGPGLTDGWDFFDETEPGESPGGPVEAVGAFFLGR